MEEALRLVQLADMVAELPQGLDSEVAEYGRSPGLCAIPLQTDTEAGPEHLGVRVSAPSHCELW